MSGHVDDIEMTGKEAEYNSNVEEIDETCGILTNKHFLLIMYIWDALNVNVNRTTDVVNHHGEHVGITKISATATEKLPGWEKPHAKKLSRGPTTWKDTRKSV